MPLDRKPDTRYDEEPEEQPTKEEDKGETATGLLPKSILRGKDAVVGDKLTLDITAIYDDQIRVEYPKVEEETEEPNPEETAEEPAREPAEVEPESGMAEEGGGRYE